MLDRAKPHPFSRLSKRDEKKRKITFLWVTLLFHPLFFFFPNIELKLSSSHLPLIFFRENLRVIARQLFLLSYARTTYYVNDGILSYAYYTYVLTHKMRTQKNHWPRILKSGEKKRLEKLLNNFFFSPRFFFRDSIREIFSRFFLLFLLNPA